MNCVKSEAEKCIFCRIIKREIPCYNVYEDKNLLAFLDINPINAGHVLIVHKRHGEDITDYSDKELKLFLPVTKKLMYALRKAIEPDGFNILINNGEISGQSVPHLHIHVIPRFPGDEKEYAIKSLFTTKKLPEKEMKFIQNNIVKNLK
jgi:histidine triad (HIT) family protein